LPKKNLPQFIIYVLPCFAIETPGEISIISLSPVLEKENLSQFKMSFLPNFAIIPSGQISNICYVQFCNKIPLLYLLSPVLQ